jgi:hypothetical protein
VKWDGISSSDVEKKTWDFRIRQKVEKTNHREIKIDKKGHWNKN